MKKPLFFLLILGALLAATLPAQTSKHVNAIRLNDDIINPVVSEYIANSIRKSEKDGAQCLILELDTPGGLLNTTRTIVKEIMGAKIPVVVYVSPSGGRAGSAGVFITMAGHVAAMAPSTNIGAAHPVDLGEKPEKKGNTDWIRELVEGMRGKTGEAEKKAATPMEEKILNDTVAWIRGIARERGRNEEWAVDAVVKSISCDEKEALEKNVIDFVAADLDDLLRQVNGRKITLSNHTAVTLDTQGAEVVRIPMTKRQSILNVLSNPNIAYILMLLGFYGLLYEFTNPGFGLSGIVGLICLVVAFYALQTLPVNYAGLILILLAIILFIAEVKVQSFGLLALAGVAAMFLGSLMLIDSPASFMRISLYYIFPLVLATAGITTFLVGMAVKAQRRKVLTGVEGLVGETGTADTDVAQSGKVFVHGEIWDAESAQKINAGEKIRVVEVLGMKLKVEKV